LRVAQAVPWSIFVKALQTMGVFSTLSKTMTSGDEPDLEAGRSGKQVEVFSDMKAEFDEKSTQYTIVEKKWRNRQFGVAVLLGILPIIAGVSQLLPEKITPWITLGISITNVIVVVVNVKLDMGERIADASMAGKGFGKLASLISMFLNKAKLGESVDVNELITQIKTTQEGIDVSLTYPEILKPMKKRNNPLLPSDPSASFGGLFKSASFSGDMSKLSSVAKSPSNILAQGGMVLTDIEEAKAGLSSAAAASQGRAKQELLGAGAQAALGASGALEKGKAGLSSAAEASPGDYPQAPEVPSNTLNTLSPVNGFVIDAC